MNKNLVLSFLFALLVAVGISVGAVLVFSLIVLMTGLDGFFVTLVNYIIKLVSLAVGVFAFASGDKGVIKGLCFGAVYAVVTELVFAAVSGGFSFDLNLLASVIYCLVVGAVVGVTAVNVKRT